MKKIINQTTGKAKSIFSCIYLFRQLQSKTNLFLIFSCVILSGCFQHYYKVNSKEVVDSALIEQLKTGNKYFIFHYEDKVMGTSHLNLVNDQLEADLVSLPKEHAHHTSPKLDTKNVMRAKHQASTLLEVHLYSSMDIPATQTHISVPFTSISRVDVYEMDASATRQSHILSVVGFSAAGIIIIGALAFIITGGLVALP